MSFKYGQGPVVTILVSKTAGRYRLQSDTFEAMWLIAQVWPAPLILLYLCVVIWPYVMDAYAWICS